MSQAKVDRYKEQKSKRKEFVEKERKRKARSKAILILVLVLVIGGIATGIGFTIRNQIVRAEAAKPSYEATSLVIGDLAGINAEEEETVEETEEAEDASEETKEAQ